MAITFPLALAAFQEVARSHQKVELSRNDIVSGLGSGQVIAAELAPPIWRLSVSYPVMRTSEAHRLRSIIETLDGSIGTFLWYDCTRKGPASDPDGSVLGAAEPEIHTIGGDNKSLRVSGLPADYVLTAGDYIAFDYGTSKRALHRIVETVTADGAGLSPSFEIRPHLPAGVVTTTAVVLFKAAAKWRLVPGSVEYGQQDGALVSGIAFQAVQVR